MDDESGGLVDDHDGVVLVDHIEGDVLGDDLELVARTVHDDLHEVEGLDAIVGLDGAAVDKDASRVGGMLDARTRGMREEGGKILVDAQKLLTLVGGETIVLVEAVGSDGSLGKRLVGGDYFEIFTHCGRGNIRKGRGGRWPWRHCRKPRRRSR